MSPEGDINLAKAEPAEESTSALQNEYTSVNLARADFSVAPDQNITRPPADTYYVNNGTQPWRADLNGDNKFVPPANNRTSDPYFNPNASRPWRAKPFEDGGTQFRRPGDPIITPPQDTTDPRYRQVLPNQSYVPDQQYLPQNQQFIPGYVAPTQQFNAQYSPEYDPRFLSNNGVPAYSGMGFQFTSNFYNVGERPPLSFNASTTFIPQGSEIPVIKINTAFPGQRSFFGVPLTTDGVINNPNNVTIPSVDNLPLNTAPVKTVPEKFNPGVVPAVDDKGNIPFVSNDQTNQVIVNPVVNTIGEINDPTKVASNDGLTLPAATTTTNGVEVRPVTTNGDPTLVAGIQPPASVLPTDSRIPTSSVLTPLDQKTQDHATDVWTGIKNNLYRGTTTTVAGLSWAFASKFPRDNKFVADLAARRNWSVQPDPNINWSAKVRDPAGAIVGVNAYELASWGYNALTGNQDWNPSSRAANVTVPLGIMAYRELAQNVKRPGVATLVSGATFGATYALDSVLPTMKDTAIGTHTGFDDVSMLAGMYAANRLPTPGVLTKIVPEALGKSTPAVIAKAGILGLSFFGGNLIESGFNRLFGKEAMAQDAVNALADDANARTSDSLARARQKMSNLSDAQWSAAQAQYVKIKAESDAMTTDKDGPEKMAISDRKLMILGAAIGENYLNNGTQVTNQGNTFLGKGTDIDLNSQALNRLSEARNAAYRLIRKYEDNVLPATINGTPVNKTAEVAALQQEVQRISGLMERIYLPHNYEAAMPEFVKAANEKPADFFTTFVRANSDMANIGEQDLRNRGIWDKPVSSEDRRFIAKTHRDRAFALLVIAQRALEVGGGREAVEALRGLPGSNEPNMNARSALNTAIAQFNALSERSPSDIENINRLKALYQRLNAQIKAKFPNEYPNTP